VAQQALDRAKVRARLQEVGGEAALQRVAGGAKGLIWVEAARRRSTVRWFKKAVASGAAIFRRKGGEAVPAVSRAVEAEYGAGYNGIWPQPIARNHGIWLQPIPGIMEYGRSLFPGIMEYGHRRDMNAMLDRNPPRK
jgi:hypothetical protein